MNVIQTYKEICDQHSIPFEVMGNVKSYDDTTLFCPAGMQQYKSNYKNENIKGLTLANIQPCIRLNDIDEVGGLKLAYFNMIGLFSFRDWDMKKAVSFFVEFLTKLNLWPVDEIVFHPDKKEWISFFDDFICMTLKEEDTKWTDGEIGGYCMEFFKDGIEIGNIVNPLGNCIDVGFGLERIEALITGKLEISKSDSLKKCAMAIIDAGFKPGFLKQEYVLRRVLREIYKQGGELQHNFFKDEVERQKGLLLKYKKLVKKNTDKSPEWWWNTHGIDLKLIL